MRALQAGHVPVFAAGPKGLVVNNTFFPLSFRISEALFDLFFLFVVVFI
jgi:hypothetical protein